MLSSFGSETAVLSSEDVRDALFGVLASLGERRKILAIPPDFTRYHSGAGELTEFAWQYFGQRLAGVLPAIGTHRPMTGGEIHTMFRPPPARGPVGTDGIRLAVLRPAPGRRPPRHRDARSHDRRRNPHHVRPHPGHLVSNARLANGSGNPGRSAGPIRPRAVRRQTRFLLAGAGEQMAGGGKLRFNLVDWPGGSPRSVRHGQLHQERAHWHGRLGRHRPQSLPGRRLWNGADHGPRRYTGPARAELA